MTSDQIVKVFIEHLKQMTREDRDCAQRRLNDTWRPVKGHAALKAAELIARDAAEGARSDWCYDMQRPFYRVAFNAAYHAIGWECAGYAAFEILGANIMRETGKPFFFLPLFGFANAHAVLPGAITATAQRNMRELLGKGDSAARLDDAYLRLSMDSRTGMTPAKGPTGIRAIFTTTR